MRNFNSDFLRDGYIHVHVPFLLESAESWMVGRYAMIVRDLGRFVSNLIS